MRTICLDRSHFILLSITLLVILPLICAIVFQRDIHLAYTEYFVAPEMQRQFGYVAEWKTIQGMNLYVITSIVPEGLLAKMGFEVGDIPFEYHSGFQAFYSALQEARDGIPSKLELMREAHVMSGDFTKRTIFVKAIHEIKKVSGAGS